MDVLKTGVQRVLSVRQLRKKNLKESKELATIQCRFLERIAKDNLFSSENRAKHTIWPSCIPTSDIEKSSARTSWPWQTRALRGSALTPRGNMENFECLNSQWGVYQSYPFNIFGQMGSLTIWLMRSNMFEPNGSGSSSFRLWLYHMFTHFSHGLSSFFIIFPHFLPFFCQGNHSVTLRPRDATWLFGPRKTVRCSPKDLESPSYIAMASGGPVPTMAVPRSGKVAWPQLGFSRLWWEKQLTFICQAVFELLWGNDGDGDDDDEELFQDKPTGSEYWTKRGRGDWGRDGGIGSSIKSKLNSEKAFWCRPSPEQTRAALQKNYYSHIDLPKVATTNLPNLPGEMHPDPAFVPRLRKGQRADFPTGNKMKPTNPHAHTYVNGTDVKTHGYAVTHNTFLQ